jgi:hypothetical protein
MANALQSSQCTATVAPQSYTNYLNCVAKAGTAGLNATGFVGANAEQCAAFKMACENAGKYQPVIDTAVGNAQAGANANVANAGTSNIEAATKTAGLCSAKPYYDCATKNSAQLAQCYMNPFLKCHVANASNIAMRNMDMYLDPQVTGAAVGSGQFGSSRGAAALAQARANAMSCLNQNISNMESCGYKSALDAALRHQVIAQGVGTSAGTLTECQNRVRMDAAKAAIDAANKCAMLKEQASVNETNAADTGTKMNISCACNRAKMGAERQTIEQNAKCYALKKAQCFSCLYRGLQVPTTIKSTATPSGLSSAATIASMIKCGTLTGALKCAASSGLGYLKCYFNSGSNSAGLPCNSMGNLNPTGTNPDGTPVVTDSQCCIP